VLKSAKEMWDVFKTTHKGDRVTKITKWMIEMELGRFTLNKGEELQAMSLQETPKFSWAENPRK
jgi:hypothetical protein